MCTLHGIACGSCTGDRSPPYAFLPALLPRVVIRRGTSRHSVEPTQARPDPSARRLPVKAALRSGAAPRPRCVPHSAVSALAGPLRQCGMAGREPGGPSLSSQHGEDSSPSAETWSLGAPRSPEAGAASDPTAGLRPLARDLRTLPDRRTPSRSLLASLPMTGPRVGRVDGPRPERSWSRRLGGRTGHAASDVWRVWRVWRSGGLRRIWRVVSVHMLGSSEDGRIVGRMVAPHRIQDPDPVVG
jgi:hypothetical protein